MWRDDVDYTQVGRPARDPARTWSRRVVQVGAVALVAWAGVATPSSAHVIVTPSTTAAGAHAVLEFSVGHGCKNSPTTKLTIQLPPGINSVTPTRTALWKVEKKLEKLDPPVVDAHGNKIVERVGSVTFSTGTPLPDGQREVFELAVQLPDAEGKNLVFPTIQTCQVGESAWIEVPQNGQNIKELALPAPALVISMPADSGHHGATSTTGDSQSGKATAAAPEANDDKPLTYAALAAGVLGSVLGGTVLLRQRRRT
ncbi:YcnI family protein [Kribbella catacumbae]|uniref:YcnI family copper-binding membrane protein n=1 Tax=Kribbella catacumbae TaxID=460086 RepID=UPI0003756CE8|nr:YcnI family protein [Kribbella catacumbae]